MPRILIADDQQDVLEALRFLMKGEGYAGRVCKFAGAVVDASSRAISMPCSWI